MDDTRVFSISYSGHCAVCGKLHVKRMNSPWDRGVDDYFSVGCTNADCDLRNGAFMTRDPEGYVPERDAPAFVAVTVRRRV